MRCPRYLFQHTEGRPGAVDYQPAAGAECRQISLGVEIDLTAFGFAIESVISKAAGVLGVATAEAQRPGPPGAQEARCCLADRAVPSLKVPLQIDENQRGLSLYTAVDR